MSVSTLLCAAGGTAIAAIVLWDAFESVLVPRRIGRRFRFTNLFYLVTPGTSFCHHAMP